jgi:glycosyltransferase involved in cell wall biosynthesis
MKKIKVIQAVNQLGLGGTEYALQLFAKFLNKQYFDVTVIGFLKGGERVKVLEDLGIEVIVMEGDFSRLPALLEKADVLHWHGGGALDSELFQILKTTKPKLVIQTNVFGIYEPSSLYDLIDYDLYISKMILVRRMESDKKLPNNFANKRKVLPYPVDIDHINSMRPSASDVSSYKKLSGLENLFIVGRIGRPDNQKFDLITLTGFAYFAKKVPTARFLLIGATPEMISHAQSLGIKDKLIIKENTVDLQKLLIYYKSMDVFLAASQIGESFGMVIAEAMTIGIPVVTISTEDRDNAQIELMDNERSGLVVKRQKGAIARALNYLYKNPEIREKLSSASKIKIAKDYQAQKIVGSLERLIFTHFQLPMASEQSGKTLVQSYSKEMADDYKKRCVNLFGRPKIIASLLLQLKKFI